MPRDLLANPPVPEPRDLLGDIMPPAATPKKRGIIGTLAQPSIGAAKGVGDLAFNVAKFGKTITDKTGISKVLDSLFGELPLPNKPEILKPEGLGQKIGFGAEKMAELVVPLGGEAGVAAKAAKYGKPAALAAKSAIGALDFGARTAIQTGGDAKKTKEAMIAGGAMPPVLAGVGAAAKKIAPSVGRTAAAVVGTLIGKEPEHIIRAFKNPEKIAAAMSRRTIPLDVRGSAVSALKQFQQSYMDDFGKGLETTKKLYPYGKTGKIIIEKEMRGATEGLPKVFRELRISVQKNGSKLNFDKLNSSIVSPTEQLQLQKAWDTIRNQKDFSVQGVQDVAARLNALTKFAEGGKDVSSVAVAKLHSTYDKAIAKAYPELGKLRSEYSAASKMYQEIDAVLRSAADNHANPVAMTTAARKLSNLFKEDNEAYLRAIQKLEKVSGKDLLNELAASEFRNIMPGKLGSYIGQAGVVAGGVASNPLLLLTLPLFSPRLIGKVSTGLGKAAPKAMNTATTVAPAVIKGATRLIQE